VLELRHSRLGALTAAVVACLLAAACGSDAPRGNSQIATGSPNPAVAVPATDAQKSRPPARPGVTVRVKRTAYGPVLVDGRGRALYLFTRDRTATSRCHGACAHNWPPFLTAGKPVAGAHTRADLLGRTRRGGHAHQVTYRGHPLYYYVGDRHPGQVLCQDVEEFGGRWYVVTRNGNAVL
jgi:predicted lipoprotein with Yx(FWY)xxD motif